MDLKGIDVSSYHGIIKWDKVKESGIQFVLIRAGWGKDIVDPRFRKNIEGAASVGLKVGVYWYLYGKTEKDIVANAKKCHEMIYPYKNIITCGVWGVWGNDSETYHKCRTKKDRTELVRLFLNTLAEQGYKVGYYADRDYYRSKFNGIEYPLWFSHLATSNDVCEPLIWQYDIRGRVDGIVARVNLNICYGDIKDFVVVKRTMYPSLKKGSDAPRVSMLQSILAELGYEVDMTGRFDPKTYIAVKKYQLDNNIKDTGEVDDKMWEMLVSRKD